MAALQYVRAVVLIISLLPTIGTILLLIPPEKKPMRRWLLVSVCTVCFLVSFAVGIVVFMEAGGNGKHLVEADSKAKSVLGRSFLNCFAFPSLRCIDELGYL